jgi:hypothetical protein
MVSPMREKRVWPPQRDADGESVAAFEAAVAVVKETVVRSGEVLVSAKEDLSDHQRWLKAQSEAVQADRERYERWLQRQRERQEALEKREQKRAKRRAARQARARAVKNAIGRVVLSIRSALWSAAARAGGGFGFVARRIGGAFGALWAKLRLLLASAGVAIGGGLGAAGDRARALLRAAAGAAASGLKHAGAKIQAAAPSVSRALSGASGGIAARAMDGLRNVRGGFAVATAQFSAASRTALRMMGERLAPALRAAGAKAYALSPAIWERFEKTGMAAKARLARLSPPKAAAAAGENALSWQGLRGFDLSQMLIIAGALLLVVGGLMLGGGLMLRAGTPASPVAEAPAGEPIAWLFEHEDFPLEERSIFVSNPTPEGLRIKGFSVGAVNLADAPIEGLEAVFKPDNHGEELKLDVIVVRPGEDTDTAPAAETGRVEAEAVAAAEHAEAGTIPPQAPFKLVFLFPGAEGTAGMTPEDVVKESGGILLKVRYQVGGTQKSFIHYLPASFLEEQLAELQAGAKGS